MRLSDQAASYLFLESAGAPMHTVGLSVLHGDPDLEFVKEVVLARLERIPKYRKRLRFVPFNLAQPVLVDDPTFHIDHHLSVHDLPDNATLDDAIRLALELTARPLPRSQPLWAMHLIKGFGGSMLVHVSHLALMGGLNLGDDAHVFFDLQREPNSRSRGDWQPEREPTGTELVAQAIRDNTAGFSERTRRLRGIRQGGTELLRRATESVTRFITEPVCSAPWNLGFVGPARKFHSVSVPYLEVRRIRRALGGTDNDVILAVLAEAAACYMQGKGLALEGQHLRIMCPVKVRREDEHGVRGDRISGMFPFLDAEPLGIAKRLEQVRWETEAIKQNREAQSLQLLSELAPPLPPVPDVTGIMPGAQAAARSTLNLMTFNPTRFLRQFMPERNWLPGLDLLNNLAGFNFSCITAAGAQTSLYFCGHEVKAQMMVPVLAANLGLGAVASTYAQTLTFNLAGDAALMPDLEVFADLVRAQLQELHEFSTNTGSASTAA